MGLFSKLFGGGEAKPKIVAHVACGGAIRIFGAPPAPPWHFEEIEREGDGFVATELVYMLPGEPM